MELNPKAEKVILFISSAETKIWSCNHFVKSAFDNWCTSTMLKQNL